MRKLILGLCLLAFSCSGAVVSNLIDIGTSTLKTVNASGTVTASNFVGSAAGLTTFAGSTNILWVVPSKSAGDASAIVGDFNHPFLTLSNALITAASQRLTNGWIYIPSGETANLVDWSNTNPPNQRLWIRNDGIISIIGSNSDCNLFVPTTNTYLRYSGMGEVNAWEPTGLGIATFLKIYAGVVGVSNTMIFDHVMRTRVAAPLVQYLSTDFFHFSGSITTNIGTILLRDSEINGIFDNWYLQFSSGDATNTDITLESDNFIADCTYLDGILDTLAQGAHFRGGHYHVKNCTFQGINGGATSASYGLIVHGPGTTIDWVNSWANASGTNGSTTASVNFTTAGAVVNLYGQMCPTNEILSIGNATINQKNDFNGNSFTGNGSGLTNLNISVSFLPTNALSTWPTAPQTRGGAALVNSNGTLFWLTSLPASATWAATNKIVP